MTILEFHGLKEFQSSLTQSGNVNAMFVAKTSTLSLLAIGEKATQRALLLHVEILQHLLNSYDLKLLKISEHKLLSVSRSEVAYTQQFLGACKHRQLCRVLADLEQVDMNTAHVFEATVDVTAKNMVLTLLFQVVLDRRVFRTLR